MKDCFHMTLKTKTWFRNMDNRILDYRHMSEDNLIRFAHMDHKCRIDRVGGYPRVWRWR